jgi:uncharacterized protein YbjT (DUF2867 family)
MRILLTGATGLIGSAVLSQLVRDGHDSAAVSRHGTAGAAVGPGTVRWAAVDVMRMTPEMWAPYLAHVQVVINCAGVLQDSPWDTPRFTPRVRHRCLPPARRRMSTP